MSGQSWKAEERTIAAALGGRRNPNNGRAQSDVSSPRFAVECKKRKSLPLWLRKAVLQARAGCVGAQRPVTVLSLAPGPGTPIQRYVVLEFDDFLALANGPDFAEAHADGGHE
jgi:hypothetical protein